MSKRYWFVFLSMQLLGVLLSNYAMSLQVGTGGWRELVWIAATLLLLPGMLIGFAAGASDISPWLGKWNAIPLFTLVVLVNAACWAAIALLVRNRKSAQEHSS